MAVRTIGGPGQSLRRRVVRLAANGVLLCLLLTGAVAFASPLVPVRPAPPVAASGAGRLAVERLLLGIAGQEAGLRAYAAGRGADDLAAYEDGRARADRALGQLQRATAGTARVGQAAQLAAENGDWQRWAEGVRAAAAAGGAPDAAGLAAGDGLLGRVRADALALRSALAADAAAVEAAARGGSLGPAAGMETSPTHQKRHAERGCHSMVNL